MMMLTRYICVLLCTCLLVILVSAQTDSSTPTTTTATNTPQAQQSGSSVGLTESLLSGSEQALVPNRLFTRLKQFFLFDARPHVTTEQEEQQIINERKQHWHHLVQDLTDILISPAPIGQFLSPHLMLLPLSNDLIVKLFVRATARVIVCSVKD